MKAYLLALLCIRTAAAASFSVEVPRALPISFGSPAVAVPPSMPVLSAASAPSASPLAVAAPAVAPAPWVPVPGTPYVLVGAAKVDRRAPGAGEVLKSLEIGDKQARERAAERGFDGGSAAWPVVGIFRLSDAKVLNGFALGSFGVRGHSDALPPGTDARAHGGYTLFLRPDGQTSFMTSGSLLAKITPPVRRAVLRYYGVRPARETSAGRFGRWAWRVWDGLVATFRS